MTEARTGEPGPTRDMSEPIFIVGCGRSGTTLLRLMLNRHPRIAVPGETWFFPRIHALRDRVGSLPSGSWRDVVEREICGAGTFDELEVSREEVSRELARLERDEWPAVVAAANRAFARTEGKARWGDKTPGYVRHLPLVRELYPDAVVLHMIRDGRDVALSFRGKPFGPRDTVSAARWWSDDVERGRTDGPRLFGDRYLEVKYEELVHAPEEVLRRVCRVTGEAFEPAMMRPWEGAGEYLRGDHWWHDRAREPIDTSRAGRWKSEMSEREVRVFELESGALLEALGYEPLGGAGLRARIAWCGGVLRRWGRAVLDVTRRTLPGRSGR